MTAVNEGLLLWEPPEKRQVEANVQRYMSWLKARGHSFNNYGDLWEWSVANLEAFWASIWDFSELKSSKIFSMVLEQRKMPGAMWFVGAELNYAEHIFRNSSSAYPALIFKSESQAEQEVSWADLHKQVASIAFALRRMGVGVGDRVVSYLPNIPEAVIAFLACASLGAIWSSCSPDFGASSVIDRFKQIEPKVLFAVDGYQYNGKTFDRRQVISELRSNLPSLEKIILVPYLNKNAGVEDFAGYENWQDLITEGHELTFTQLPFNHPIWILYSSGTTGLPKAIVQGHGGILLEHLKSLSLHLDLKEGDRFFWFTTTGWMMWNYLVSGLLLGTTIVLYDGSPAFPDPSVLWSLAEKTGVTYFGTSAAYITSCMKARLRPGEAFDLSRIVSIGSTGSPLPAEGFKWIYENVKKDVWLASLSGGTDVCTAFVGGCPLLPVRAGQLQCRCLGAKVEAFDERGQPVISKVGELVVTEPLPSMPLFFWNDPGNCRYYESYFDTYPGVWRHGDWIKINPGGSVIMYGRSDSTINRHGVRVGTSEIYNVVEAMPEIADSLVIDMELLGGSSYMPLFVVLKDAEELSNDLKQVIKTKIATALSPRFVPDQIISIQEVPRTINGKKLEIPVKRILMGLPVEKAANLGAMANPQSILFFSDFAVKVKNRNLLIDFSHIFHSVDK